MHNFVGETSLRRSGKPRRWEDNTKNKPGKVACENGR
jgi:hypothetical protein